MRTDLQRAIQIFYIGIATSGAISVVNGFYMLHVGDLYRSNISFFCALINLITLSLIVKIKQKLG